MSGSKSTTSGTVAFNRKARFEYAVEEELEAGIVLTGTEVKSMRAGKVISLMLTLRKKTGKSGYSMRILQNTVPVIVSIMNRCGTGSYYCIKSR